MSLLGRLLGGDRPPPLPDRVEPALRASPENPSVSLTDPAIFELFGAAQSAAGIAVSERSAFNALVTVQCAVRRVAEAVSSLPLILYERTGEGTRERRASHPLHWLIHDQPNPEMTALEYWELVTGNVELWGNHYSEIERNGAGAPMALWPIPPDRVEPFRLGGRKLYRVSLPDGGQAVLDDTRIFHVPGFRYDGLKGVSTVGAAREAIGLSIGMQEFGARYFANNAHAGTVLEHPGKLSDQAQTQIVNDWNSKFGGVSKAHRTALLIEGMKANFVTMSAEDSQFLQSRQFQVREVARMFRIPPHMLADYEGMALSNFEQQALDYVVHSIRPRLVRIERRVNMQLVAAGAQGRLYAEFLVDALLRGDMLSQTQAMVAQLGFGLLTVNEGRAARNMNPVDGGDVAFRPLNMERLDAPIAPRPAAPAVPPNPAPPGSEPAGA